jgi:hypothetical protein
VSAAIDLQAQIEELVKFPDKPAANWVARVRSAPDDVIAGAMLMWTPPGGGLSANPGDPAVVKRETAHAILVTRLSERALESNIRLRNTIDEYQRKSGRQTNVMIALTVLIAVLTLAIAGLTVAQIWITLRPGHC